MKFMHKLLANLNSYWKPEPGAVPILAFTASEPTYTKVTVADGHLHFHSAGYRKDLPKKASIYLDGIPLRELVGVINNMGLGVTAALTSEVSGNNIDPDSICGEILLEVTDVSVSSAVLEGFTSPTWKMLYPLQRALQLADNDIDRAIDQMWVGSRKSFWLDFWGSFVGIMRGKRETDANYIHRVQTLLLAPVSNNIAMERIIAASINDPTVQVLDVEPLVFYVSVAPNYTKSEHIQSDEELRKLINDIKCAGTTFFLNFAGKNSEDYWATMTERLGYDYAQSDVYSFTPLFTYTEAVYGYSVTEGGSHLDMANGFVNDESFLMQATRRLRDDGMFTLSYQGEEFPLPKGVPYTMHAFVLNVSELDDDTMEQQADIDVPKEAGICALEWGRSESFGSVTIGCHMVMTDAQGNTVQEATW